MDAITKEIGALVQEASEELERGERAFQFSSSANT